MNERGPVYRYRYDPAVGDNVLRLLPVAVYGYYDTDGTCLYIGQTTDPAAREHYHRSKSPWHTRDLEWRELGLYLKRGDALTAEARAIRDLSPVHNKIHAKRGAIA